MDLFSLGVVCNQTAFEIYEKLSKSITDFWFSTIEIKLQTADYQLVKQRFQAKHLSNHKYQVRVNNPLSLPDPKGVGFGQRVRTGSLLRCDERAAPFTTGLPMSGDVSLIVYEAEACSSNVVAIPVCLNGSFVSVNLENLGTVTFGMLFDPIFNLRNCKSINEAITSWALNYNFLKCKGVICVKNLSSEILNLVEIESLSNKLLTNPNSRFIPEKILYKFQQVTKQTRPDPLKFMCLVNELYFYLCKLVQKHYTIEQVDRLIPYHLIFPIKLFCQRKELQLVKDGDHRAHQHWASLRLVQKFEDDLKFKSLGILFNLRWFFNTRNNNKKIFGLDGEYGLTDEGLIGQTFHKYDDVLLWLVSNPNTLEEVEFVVIDHISDFYIFNF